MKITEKLRCIRKYLWYVIKHKYFVAIECFKVGLIWRGIKHDIDKLFPDEFFPYAFHFYKDKRPERDKTGYYKPVDTGNYKFEEAWLKHCRRNTHHWQYYALATENNIIKYYEMPYKDCLEMICDWKGAGKAQKSIYDVKQWYEINGRKILLHPNSKKIIELLLR